VSASRSEGPGSASLPELEQRRAELYARLAELGDFRRGSVNGTYRRCGKANCACADPVHPGHGPRYLWTRSYGGKTEGHQLSPGPELDKVSAEVANYKDFVDQVDQIVEVNEAICEARPISPLAEDRRPAETPGPEKGGSSRRSRRASPKR